MSAVAGLLPLLLVQAPDVIKIQARIWSVQDRLSITTRKITSIRSIFIGEGSKPIDNEDVRDSDARVLSAPTLVTIGGQEATMVMALSAVGAGPEPSRIAFKLVPVVTGEGNIIVSYKQNVKSETPEDAYDPLWPSVIAELNYRSGESGFVMVPFPGQPERKLLVEMKITRNPASTSKPR